MSVQVPLFPFSPQLAQSWPFTFRVDFAEGTQAILEQSRATNAEIAKLQAILGQLRVDVRDIRSAEERPEGLQDDSKAYIRYKARLRL
jgi:hypothetical protein